MPYLEGGHVGRHERPNLADLKTVVCQTLEALAHLHEREFTHRDIKPNNILIRNAPEEPLHVVVADYGLISWKNTISVVGTPGYMAPEIYKNHRPRKGVKPKDYGSPVDIYALGILILWAFGLTIPEYPIKTRPVHQEDIMSQVERELANCDPENTDRRGALYVARRMLQFNPTARPTAKTCLQSPWLFSAQTRLPTIKGPSTPSDAPTFDTLLRDATARPTQDLWDSSPRPTRPRRNLSSRHPKKPVEHTLTKNRNKVQKALQNSLPTPRLTPVRKEDRGTRAEGDNTQDVPGLRGSDEVSPTLGSDKSREKDVTSGVPSNWYDIDLLE